MSNRGKENFIFWLGFASVIALGAVCGMLTDRGGEGAARLILGTLLALLVFAIAALSVALRVTLKETTYAYRNIAYIGGILFAATMAVVLLRRFVLCLRADDFSMHYIYHSVVRFPREFSYYAVFFIVVLCVLLGVSNVSLMRHEGYHLHNALSLLVALVYLGGTFLAYRLSDLLHRYVFASGNALLTAVDTAVSLFLLLMLCYFECFLVGTIVLGWYAARYIPKYDKDYVIILGCSIDKRGGLLPLLKGRVNRAIRFAWDQEIATGKAMKYVPSGGQGANEVMSEGSAMELYLLTRGAESDEVMPEKASKSTWENMVFSKKLIDEIKPNARVAFATTNYHILRSGILARRAGLDAEGIAGDTKWYFWPNGFVREFFAILTMNVKAHVFIAIVTALCCALIGGIGYFGHFI